MTVIGSAYVDIRAITDKLASDIRTAIESITDSITINVDADVSSATAKLDALSENRLEDQTITVDADTSDAQRSLDDLANTVLGDQTIHVSADTTQARRELDDIANISHLQDQTVHMGVDVDPTQAIIDLHEIANQSLRATVDLEANTLAARRELDDMLDDMGSTITPTVTPDVDDAAARLRLALLTMRRQLRINVVMNSAPLVAAGNAIARMTGARVLADDIGKMAKHFINIDKAVPGIAMMSTVIGSIAGAAMSSIGGLSTLGASLGSIIAMVAIAAPGIATGFLVGIGTLMVALKDFGKQLPQVTAQYKTLGATIKGNYWDVARESIRDMATTLFPQFESGLARTSRALGGWSATFADAMKLHLDNGVLSYMFENLAKSIDIAKGGLEPFTRAMVELGGVGSALLPRLASWWVDVSNKFSEFIINASTNGDLTRWIEEGITNLKRLGSLIGETAGFFGGLTGAAKMAGSDGLGTLLSFMTRMNDAVNSPEGMKQLATIFEGANTVATALGDGFFKIMGAVGSASPAIKSAFESIGGVINVVSDAISKIISNPEFQAGFTAMFDGIEKGFGALMPVVGEMGPKMGAFLSIIGSLAANIGGVLAAALEVALPLVTALKLAIDPLIPILGDALINIIKELGPTFTIFADAIKQVAPAVADVVKWATDLVVELVDTLGPALPGITAAVLAFMAGMKLGAIIQTVVNGIKSMVTFMGLLRTGSTLAAAAQTVWNVSLFANPIGLIIGAIAAFIAIVVVAYNNVGWFKDFVDQSMGMIVDAVEHLVNFWNHGVVPMWDAAMSAAGDFFGAIGAWIGSAVKAVQDFFGGFGKGAGDAQASVGGFFDGIGQAIGDFVGGVGNWFAGIGQGIADAFNGAVAFVTPIIDFIGSIISTGVNNIITNWTNAFNLVRDIFVNVWNGLVWFFQPLVDLIFAIIKGVVEISTAFWTAAWEIVSTIFIGIWTNIVRVFEPIIQGISDTITTVVGAVSDWWNSTWQGIVDFFTGIWTGIMEFLAPIVQGISDTITNAVNGVTAAWNAAWQFIGDYFASIWNGMVAFYGPILQGIWDFIVSVGEGISSAWNQIWSAISSFFTERWNNIVSNVTGAVNLVRTIITNVVNAISNAWNATWSAVGNYISQVWSNIVSSVTGFVGDVQRNIQNVLDTMGRIGSDILRNIGDFGTLLLNSGRDMINGLTQGITNGKDAVVQTIKNIASGALDAIKNFFGIKSPSRVMRDQVGKQLGLGLAIGIEASIGAVLKATDKLAAAAVPDIADIMLPAVKTASGASQRVSTVATTAPALTRASVTGSTSNSTTGTGVFGQQSNVAPVVNFNVQTTPGLNEVQVGEHAMNYMYWKLSSSTPL